MGQKESPSDVHRRERVRKRVAEERKRVREVGGKGRKQTWEELDSHPSSFLWVPICFECLMMIY